MPAPEQTKNLTGAELQAALTGFARVLGVPASSSGICDATPTYFSPADPHPQFVHTHYAKEGPVQLKEEIKRVVGGTPEKVYALWLQDTNTLKITEERLVDIDRGWRRRVQDQAVMVAPADFAWVMSFHKEDYASVNRAFASPVLGDKK